MAELTTAERLQPSLLDRLTDQDPAAKVESRDKRVLSLQDIRAAVIRDLAWLINTTSLSAVEDLESYPEISSSVLNFGIPELTGLTSHAVDTAALARIVKQAILNFEPRFLPRTLKVEVEANPSEMSGNTLIFRIEGQIWAKPSPLALHLRTEVDLESNNAVVVEASR